MKETRIAKYGRNFALWIDRTIQSIPESNRAQYKSELIQELEKYFSAGNIRELEGIDEVDIDNSREFGKLIKEGLHFMYQKDTSGVALKTALNSLIKKIE